VLPVLGTRRQVGREAAELRDRMSAHRLQRRGVVDLDVSTARSDDEQLLAQRRDAAHEMTLRQDEPQHWRTATGSVPICGHSIYSIYATMT